MKLICIDPAQARDVWRFVEPLINKALQRGISDPADIRDDVFGNMALLWIVWDGDLRAAVVTQLTDGPRGRFCTIVACAGHKFSDWEHLYPQLEEYAKSQGCKAMRINGRWGWKRTLDGYRIKSVTLEKVL